MSEATCRCAHVARTYRVLASAFRAAWVYVDKRCHRWLPSDRYRTIPVSSLSPEVRMTDLFLDTDPPEKPPTVASVIHLPIPPYHSIRLKPSSSRSLSPIKPSISAQHSKKPISVNSCDPLDDVVEIPIHPAFHTNYTEMTAGKTNKSGGTYYDHIAKLVSRSILLKQEIHLKWKSVVLRENEWIIVGWALVYRRYPSSSSTQKPPCWLVLTLFIDIWASVSKIFAELSHHPPRASSRGILVASLICLCIFNFESKAPQAHTTAYSATIRVSVLLYLLPDRAAQRTLQARRRRMNFSDVGSY